jgi:hypothetical protein
MPEAPNNSEEMIKLAQRHLSACEAIYMAATAQNDTDTAVHVARSALSVAFNCVLDLSDDFDRETAVLWHERLWTLFDVSVQEENYLSRALKWADGRMYHLNMRKRNEIEAGSGKNSDGY